MIRFNQLEDIHLEITNNCQASCPMCSRNVNGGLENPLISVTNWTTDEFKTILSPTVLKQIKRYRFCGNFGDPMMNNDLIEMIEYSAAINPQLYICVHTNGGARNSEWWTRLAKALPVNHLVTFALDGLSDTHSLYRVGTTYDTVVRNAKTFINAGGSAEWAYIRFKHNEHQVEQARHNAMAMGFKEFTVKNSSRFIIEPKVDVVDKMGNYTHSIEPATDTPMKFIDLKTIESFRDIVKDTVIDCKAKQDKEIYIDAHRNLYPCCHTASIPYMSERISGFHSDKVKSITDTMMSQHLDMVNTIGEVNTLLRTVEDIMDSTEYQNMWDEYWTTKKLLICARTCGVSKKIEFSLPRDQYERKNTET